jgi:AraC family transcriptional regulator
MEKQTIFIKGMVCNRCIMTVKNELESLGHRSVSVSLGAVSFISSAALHAQDELEKRLALLGFSLLEDKKTKMVKAVKALVEEVYSGNYDFPDGFRFSRLLAERLCKDYDVISDAFVAVEKKTIEQHIIEYRINKVKEMLMYTTGTLADIAFRLNFNSVAHLSAQFKQQTGLTPSFFKEIKKQKTEAAFSTK